MGRHGWRGRAWIGTAALLFLAACQGGPESRQREAEALLARGKVELAREKLEHLVADHPSHASAAFLLGQLYLSRKDFASAERCLAQGLEHAPERFGQWIHLARARLELLRFEPALEALAAAEARARGPLEPVMARRWIAEASQLAALSARVAELQAGLGLPTRRQADDLAELINLHLEMVRCWTHLNLPERAEATWAEVFQLGNQLILELEASLRAAPEQLDRRLHLASALLSAAKRWAVVRKNPEQMERYLLRADPLLGSVIEAATGTPRLRAEAAAGAVSLYLMRNRLDDAQIWIDKAVEWDPQRDQYRYTRAQVLYQRGFLGQALEVMEAYLAETGSEAEEEAHLFHARLLRAAGRPGEALAAARRAVERAPDELPAQFLAIELLLALGETEAARAEIARLARLDLYPPEMKELHALQQQLARRPAGPAGPSP